MEAVETNRLKMKKIENVSIAVQPRTKTKQLGPSSRLYRAPQSSIRRIDSETVVTAPDKSCSARRRRQSMHTNKNFLTTPSPSAESRLSGESANPRKHHTKAPRTHHDINSSDESSSNSVLEMLEAPYLWMDDVEGNLTGAHPSSSWSVGHLRTRQSRHRQQRKNKLSSTDSAMSEQHYGDDESIYTHLTTLSMCDVPSALAASEHGGDQFNFISGKGKLATMPRRCKLSWNRNNKSSCGDKKRSCMISITQVAVLIFFAFVVCDSRRRVHEHKQQLQQYDEERAHILEQMTWIDNAAKKVHKKYAGFDNLLLSTQHEKRLNDPALMDENKFLKAQLDQLQLRVQQNARDRTVRQFGDNPVQVALPVTEGDVTGEHIVIALSDDTPHAASIFLQQVGAGMWDEVDFQRLQNGRVLQAATRYSNTMPVLEFIEKSRGCHTAGSVALHQLESDDFHLLVLKIHMEESNAIDANDVCIGTVLSGLETLEQIIPQIPVIRDEET